MTEKKSRSKLSSQQVIQLLGQTDTSAVLVRAATRTFGSANVHFLHCDIRTIVGCLPHFRRVDLVASAKTD